MSDYLEGQFAAHLTGTSSMTKPTALYVALFTSAPSDSGGGTEVSTSGTAYARQNLAPSNSNWTQPTGGTGVVTNAVAINYPTATGSWGTITHFAIFDASTGGNMLVWGALGASKVVGTSDVFSFAIGTITLTFA